VRIGIFQESGRCLALTEPEEKCAAVAALTADVAEGSFEWDLNYPLMPIGEPGRPAKPELVEPSRVPRRRLGNEEGRAALVHAIAHIEFNAINLALDAVYRFRDMPRDYYLDWISVAGDEARHFLMLQERLCCFGRSYGDFPAHNGLWEMAQRTAHDCLVRMALVPRVLEARGLDVTPGMIQRLRAVGDEDTVAALEVILKEEVRHVAIGTRWFNDCCERRGKEPGRTFLSLLESHFSGVLRGPYNLEARFEAGFTPAEMDSIMSST
jgi:uncharacterized ferritin-like protein (DUF455 family)